MKQIEAELRNVAAYLLTSPVKGDDEMYYIYMGMIYEVFKNLEKREGEYQEIIN